jgi:predicted component of type VI protein secretion system
MAMPDDAHGPASAHIPMPALSDEAVVQIQDFIHHFLDLFEARYGDQIHRYYADRSVHYVIHPGSSPNIDDPPF